MKRKGFISSILIIALLTSMFACMFTVHAVTGNAGETVYIRTTNGTPTCYMWLDASGSTSQNAAWPGVKMTEVETNIYAFTLDKSYDKVIFIDNGGKTDDLDYQGDGMLYDKATKKWEQYKLSTNPPVVSFSKKDGASFSSDTVDVKVNPGSATSATYKIDNGSAVPFTGETVVTLGNGVAVGSTTTLYVSATNEYGTTEKSITLLKKEPQNVGGGDGSTSPSCGGYYGTNPDGKVGVRKTISIDGDKSDWSTDMLIAQGTANDDPRVYRDNSMYEIPIDDYAMYAAWDDKNLYIMYEMCNVQDIVAPNDDYPLSQGTLFKTQNCPVFLYLYTGKGTITDGTTVDGGTLWGSGITFDTYVDTVVAFSTNGSNGPFIYTADDDGKLDAENIVNKNTGISLDFGNAKGLSGELWGIDGGYGQYHNRVLGDMFDESSDWVDFYAKGHDSKMDFFYEMSIPLDSLNLSASDIENTGIGVMKVSTFGTSGMDCLPYDPSMNDNADQASTTTQEFNSHEKEDDDHITVPFARVGKLLSSDPQHTTTQTQPTTSSTTQTTPTTTSTTQTTPTTTSTTQTIPTTPTTTQPTYAMGDINGDGDVDIADATILQKYINMVAVSIKTEVADVTGDGQINVRDVTTIQRKVAGYNVF